MASCSPRPPPPRLLLLAAAFWPDLTSFLTAGKTISTSHSFSLSSTQLIDSSQINFHRANNPSKWIDNVGLTQNTALFKVWPITYDIKKGIFMTFYDLWITEWQYEIADILTQCALRHWYQLSLSLVQPRLVLL